MRILILAALAFLAGTGLLALPEGLADLRRPDPVCLEPIVTPASTPCSVNAKSEIRGDTLYIDGLINGLTYDLMSVGNAGINVKHVELNSYGGDESMGELLSEMIRSRGMSTHVRENGFCASTCILLMQAGTVRFAHPSARFGVHGVRVGDITYIQEYYEACNATQAKCTAFTKQWYEESLMATRDFFHLMEKYGASPALLTDYMKQPPEPNSGPSAWYHRGNGLRISDWELNAEQASQYGMVMWTATQE